MTTESRKSAENPEGDASRRTAELPGLTPAESADVRTYVPVTEVEAVQVTTANAAAVARWCGGRTFAAGTTQVFVEVEVGPGAGARTLARDADWVVRHVDGGYEVLRDADFQRRYWLVGSRDR